MGNSLSSLLLNSLALRGAVAGIALGWGLRPLGRGVRDAGQGIGSGMDSVGKGIGSVGKAASEAVELGKSVVANGLQDTHVIVNVGGRAFLFFSLLGFGT